MRRRTNILIIGLITAVVGYTLGARHASGQGSSFKVIGPQAVVVGETAYFLEITNPPYGWREMPYGTMTLPPVSASTLASYVPGIAVTDAGEAWLQGPSGWTSYGYPGALQPTFRPTLGGLKARYR